MPHPISRGCQKSMPYKFSIVTDANFPLWVKEKRGFDILRYFDRYIQLNGFGILRF